MASVCSHESCVRTSRTLVRSGCALTPWLVCSGARTNISAKFWKSRRNNQNFVGILQSAHEHTNPACKRTTRAQNVQEARTDDSCEHTEATRGRPIVTWLAISPQPEKCSRECSGAKKYASGLHRKALMRAKSGGATYMLFGGPGNSDNCSCKWF